MSMNTSDDIPGRTWTANRRTLLGAGLGLFLGSRLSAATAPMVPNGLQQSFDAGVHVPHGGISGWKIRDLTGPAQTGQFSAPWTDLGIPVRCPNGTTLFVCGDTFSGSGVGGADWRAPVALRSSGADLTSMAIDDSVGGAHANGLVPESHVGNTTAIPSDVFTIGGTMYMHLMRGVIYQTHHSDFWRSTDNGATWQYLCQWPGSQYGGQFQQKTYLVAEDGYCYVLSTVFDRTMPSDLLMHRVPHSQVGVPSAYEPWGYAGGHWNWGNYPTTISTRRKWGEICLRKIDGKFVFVWLNMNPTEIRVQVLPGIYGDYFTVPEQTMVFPTTPPAQHANFVASPYGGFIFPGSTLDNFHIAVSQWYNNQNYRVMQYRIAGIKH